MAETVRLPDDWREQIAAEIDPTYRTRTEDVIEVIESWPRPCDPDCVFSTVSGNCINCGWEPS